MKHINIKIFGVVQGVNFRFYAKEEADKLGIRGFVSNEPDGSVYIEAEGEDDALDTFTKWCKKGPSTAKVERVELQYGKIKNFEEFLRK